MNKTLVLKKLFLAANELDGHNFKKEADAITMIMKRVAYGNDDLSYEMEARYEDPYYGKPKGFKPPPDIMITPEMIESDMKAYEDMNRNYMPITKTKKEMIQILLNEGIRVPESLHEVTLAKLCRAIT